MDTGGAIRDVHCALRLPTNRHYLRICEGCANMYKNTSCTAAQGQFSERPVFDLRQTTLYHFNGVDDNNRTDLEQAAVTDCLNCFSKQCFRFLELTNQQSRCRKWFLRRYFAFLLAFDVTQPKSIFSDLYIDGVCKKSTEHLACPYNG